MDSLEAELARWLRQFHVPPSFPWALLTTPDPIRGDGMPVSLQVDYSLGVERGSTITKLPDGFFGPEWSGYRLELLGLVEYLDSDAVQFKAPRVASKGEPPRWKLRHPRPEFLDLQVALLCQRAYVPGSDGAAPPLTSELHWWPGESVVQDYYRVTTRPGVRGTTVQLKAAEEARALLHQMQRDLRGTVGRPAGQHTGLDHEAWIERALEIEALHKRRVTRKSLEVRFQVSPDTQRRWEKDLQRRRDRGELDV
jgi:hypothetical protein